ncbi:MAG: hypothetical protein JWO18_2801 [Microbacteriaceae bacterium]|nr:hypothetical protein [Microbacteriaceae bacterium]
MLWDLWNAFADFITTPAVAALVLIVTAIATAGSVIVALVISHRAERRQDTRDQIESSAGLERRAERQAILIKTSPSGMLSAASEIEYRVEVNNLSELPIFDITARLLLTVDGEAGEYAAPEYGVIYGAKSMIAGAFRAMIGATVESVRADATFTDAYGDRWSLRSDGTLVLVKARTIREMYQFSSKPLTRRQQRVP